MGLFFVMQVQIAISHGLNYISYKLILHGLNLISPKLILYEEQFDKHTDQATLQVILYPWTAL